MDWVDRVNLCQVVHCQIFNANPKDRQPFVNVAICY
jgi:hypothetical protein